jgi:hypothetical protein
VHVVLGGIGLGLMALLLLTAIVDTDPVHRQAIGVILAVLGGLSVVYFIPSFAGGLGVLRGIYWARGLLWIEAAFLAPLVPFGTVLAGLTLWALLPRRHEMPEGDGGIAAFERFLVRWRRAAVLAFAAWATLGAMIGLGYIFRDQIEALDPQPKQELTPLPEFPLKLPDRPAFEPRPPPDPQTPSGPKTPSDGTGR